MPNVPASTFEWKLNGGDLISTSSNDTYTFDDPGVYQLTLDAVSVNGCSSRVTKTIGVNATPVADFSADKTESCSAQLQVNFANLSQGATTYSWNLGNGVNSSTANPTTTYNSPGVYNVSLTVTSAAGCRNTKKVDSLIVTAEPKLSIIAVSSSGCAPLFATFSIHKTGPGKIVGVQWNFGNGIIFNGINPPQQTYNAQENYTIKAVVSFDGGCTQQTVNYSNFNFIFSYNINISSIARVNRANGGPEVTLTYNSWWSNDRKKQMNRRNDCKCPFL